MASLIASLSPHDLICPVLVVSEQLLSQQNVVTLCWSVFPDKSLGASEGKYELNVGSK